MEIGGACGRQPLVLAVWPEDVVLGAGSVVVVGGVCGVVVTTVVVGGGVVGSVVVGVVLVVLVAELEPESEPESGVQPLPPELVVEPVDELSEPEVLVESVA